MSKNKLYGQGAAKRKISPSPVSFVQKATASNKLNRDGLQSAPPPRIVIPATGMTHISVSEKSMADLHRLIRQRGAQSEAEVKALMQEVVASRKPPTAFLSSSAPSTPLEQAQDIVYEGFDANGRKRLKLARRALAICPDCADAYVLLAEDAGTAAEARELFEQGVQAGQRALEALHGPDFFEEAEGQFWGIIETRPYLRARAGLAQALWELDERAAAIEHLQEMLRLNPNDNQGMRHLLISFLLMEKRDNEVGKLLQQYEDEVSATWEYSRALYLFRAVKKPGVRANEALEDAFAGNPFVPLYFLGVQEPPDELPGYITPGEDSEAIDYVAHNFVLWDETPGALEWMAKQMLRDIEQAMHEIDEELEDGDWEDGDIKKIH